MKIQLRPFTSADADVVQELVSAREIAENTLTIPHPYPAGGAAEWIARHPAAFAENGDEHWAIVDGDRIVGAIALMARREHDRAELGYWIGVPYWNRGYAREAVGEVLRRAFEEAHWQRVYAMHFTRNPSSGRVLLRNGLKHEGTLRQHIKKWGELLDVEMYGILRDEWLGSRRR
ncbi:MAG TPA: GNAT family N-acetyltransferase [Thermoanaerobaculia bacterium]|jgi:RimJ/RimL family protein N-acetyltransferase